MKSIKIQSVFYILFVVIIVFSCRSNDDNATSTNPYIGNWAGTYTGSKDNGTWTAKVNSDNTITGTAHSNIDNVDSYAKGTIDANGNVAIGIYTNSTSTTEQGKFTGVFKTDKTASGTWQNLVSTSYFGTWTGNKQ